MPVYAPRCAALLTVVFDARTTSAADNSPPQHIVIQPRESSVLLNGYHEADTWTLEFDARRLPFDPDSIASANCRIFMWDDLDGYVGSRVDELSSVFSNPFTSIQQKQQSLDNQFGRFEMIRGITDDDEGAVVSEDNVVKLTGRDYTAIIMAKNWDPKKTIPTGDPLDVVIQQIADDAAPATTSARFSVVWLSPDPIPTCGSVFRTSKGKKGALPVKDGKNNWDVIYDLVLQHGFITYVQGSQIIITDPATQTASTLGNSPRLVYGKHLDALTVKRKFGKDKVPQIIIRAYDPDKDEQVEVVYPAKTNVIVDGLAVTKNEQMYFPAPAGVIDKAALLRYARLMFHYKGRGETEYSFKTHCLSILDDKGAETSMLRLRTGVPIGIKFDPFNNSESLRAMSPAERYQRIRALGYASDIATFAATNIDKLVQYEQPYYLGTAKYDYDIDSGLAIEITAFNFASQHRETNFANAPTYAFDTISADAVSSGE